MQILLTNDDGIYAPGLQALERELRSLGDVCVVAPSTEQSGVWNSELLCIHSHSLRILPSFSLSPSAGARLRVVEGKKFKKQVCSTD